jgi:hypothetical protein
VTVPEIFLHFEAAATYSVGRIVHRCT